MMAVSLPRACQSLRNCKSEGDVLLHLGSLAREARPGTHKAHVAPKNVDELRQLVHEGSAECPPNASYTWVIPRLEERPIGIIQVKDFINALGRSIGHRTE